MPVAAQVDRLVWHHHDVARPRRDVVVAARARVMLDRLERLDLLNGDSNPQKGIDVLAQFFHRTSIATIAI